MNRDINNLSFDEVLEEIWLYIKENSYFDIETLIDKYATLLKDNTSNKQRMKQLYKKISIIFERNHTLKEVFFLLNQIDNERLEDDIIVIYMQHTLKKNNLDIFKTIKLFTNRKLKEKIISYSFLLFLKENYQEALLLLNNMDQNTKDIAISNSFTFIYTENKELAFKLFYEITEKKLQDKILMNGLHLFFIENENKIIPLLKNMTDSISKGSAIHNSFNSIFHINKEKAFELLDSIIDTKYYEKTITISFSKISQGNTDKAINLFNSMENHSLKHKALNQTFKNMNLSEEIFKKGVTLSFNQSEKEYILEYMKKNVIHTHVLSKKSLNGNLLKNVLRNNKDTVNFREVFINNPDNALLILNQTETTQKKDILLTQLFNQPLKKGLLRDKALPLLDKINDNNLRESAYLRVIEQNQKEQKKLITLNHTNINTVNTSSFRKLFKENSPKAIDELEKLTNKEKDILLENFFKVPLKKGKIRNKAIKLFELITNKDIRDNAIIHMIAWLTDFEMQYKLAQDINNQKKYKIVSSKYLKKAKPNSISTLFDISITEKSLQDLNNIDDTSLQLSLLTNYFILNEHKLIRIIPHITKLSIKNKLIEKFFIPIYKESSIKAFELLEKIKSEHLQYKILKQLVDYFKNNLNIKEMLQLVNCIKNSYLKQHTIAYYFTRIWNFNNKELLYEEIKNCELDDQFIITFITKLLETNKTFDIELWNILKDKKGYRNILLKKLSIIIDTDITLAKNILNKSDDSILKQLILNNYFFELYSHDEEETIHQLNLLEATYSVLELLKNSFDKLQTIEGDKVFTLIESFIQHKYKDEIILYSYDKLFYKNKLRTISLIFNLSVQSKKIEILEFIVHELLKNMSHDSIEVLNKIQTNDLFLGILLSITNREQTSSLWNLVINKNLYTKLRNQLILANADKLIIYLTSDCFINNINRLQKLIKFNLNADLQSFFIIKLTEYVFTQETKNLRIYLNQNITNHLLIDTLFLEKYLNQYQNQFLKLLNDKLLKDEIIILIIEKIPNEILLKYLSSKIYKNSIFKIINLSTDNSFNEQVIEKCFLYLLNEDSAKMFHLLYQIRIELKNFLITNFLKNLLAKDFYKTLLVIKNIKNKSVFNNSIYSCYKEYSSIKSDVNKLLNIIPNSKKILTQEFKTTLLSIQLTLNDKTQQKSIAKSYNTIYSKENIIFQERQTIRQHLGIEFLSVLLIEERELNSFKKILAQLIRQLDTDKLENDHTTLAYETIVSSHLKHESLYNLTNYIQSPYFKTQVKKIKEQTEARNNTNKILNLVLNNNKIEKYSHFMKLFKQRNKMKTIHMVIPEVLKRDFELGESLFREVKKNYLKNEIRVHMFKEIYQKDLKKAQSYYNYLDDFHTKRKLSRLAIDKIVPEFSDSFFVKSLSTLDTQNIINTPMELARTEPYEILKYYGEIKNEEKDELATLVKNIDILQQRRDEAKNTRDMQELKNIVLEVGKLKESLNSDNKLFDIFLERYKLDEFEFMELNLLNLKL